MSTKKSFKPEILFIKQESKLRLWRITVTAESDRLSNEVALIKVVHGLLPGKVQEKKRFVTQGKNEGKSNATTPFEQASLEATAEHTVMRNKGYRGFSDFGIVVTKDEFKNTVYVYNENNYTYDGVVMLLDEIVTEEKKDIFDNIKPMILHHGRLTEYLRGSRDYKSSKTIRFPCVAQFKYDGVCSVVHPDGTIYTRQGKPTNGPGAALISELCPQIANSVATLRPEYPLHGELYAPEFNLQDITSATKKAYPLSKLLEIQVFDIVVPGMPYHERADILTRYEEMVKGTPLELYIKFVQSTLCATYEEMLVFEEKALDLGYEGIVVRTANGKYLPGKRSPDVLKIVRFNSSEVKVVDVIPMEKEPTHGMFVCQVPKSNNTFKVTPSDFSHQQRMEILMNKAEYIGKYLTIEHRGYTRDGVPRIATGKAIRSDHKRRR